jgi:predicted transcriptional regulator YheO
MDANQVDFFTRLAHAIATQFGPNCEVVVHDLEAKDPESTIVAIENGHITGRAIGDGPSHVVLEAIKAGKLHKMEDRLGYLTKTNDGRILRSTTIFIKNDDGQAVGVLGINYDITIISAAADTLNNLTGKGAADDVAAAEPIVKNVADLLDDLIEQSVALVGKPAALMSKDERVRAIRYLNDTGAFLITKSGPKVCKYFGISKYTLYSYLDEAKGDDAEQ